MEAVMVFADRPEILLVIFGLGLIIGSFLNVYLYRFHTGKSLGGQSHCLSCRTPLRPYELIPLLSYLALWGRCRTCGARIPSRYFLVELGTGILFVMVALTLPPLLWLFGFVLVSVLMVTLVYDLYHMIIPNEFVLALGGLALLYLAYLIIYVNASWWVVISAIGGALLGPLFFYGLWWYSNGRWIGYGDVKLAAPLGLMVGISGAFSMIVLSFWIGTLLSVGAIGYQRLRHRNHRGQPRLRIPREHLTIQSEVPFAPFLIMAFLMVYFYRANVLTLFTF